MDSQKKTIFLHNEYNDLDHYIEACKPWESTADQLTSGRFHGEVSLLKLNHFQFMVTTFNQALRVKGNKLPNLLTFDFFSSTSARLLSHGHVVTAQDLFAFDSTRETDLISSQGEGKLMIAGVDTSTFLALADQMGYEDCDLNFLSKNIVRTDPNNLDLLRAYYQQITAILKTNLLLFQSLNTQSFILEDFILLLVSTVGSLAKKDQLSITPFHRFKLIKKAEEIAQNYQDEPLTLQKLCDELGTSSRSLRYGFQDIFGISPMAYLKIQRLNGVRRALKKSDPTNTTVMQLAHQWGFWSLGHLSRDYKHFFGESPSETLKRLN